MSEVIYGLPAADYRARPEINCSGLKLINKSPLHYRSGLDQPKEETRAMLIGSAVHTATLEPHLFDQQYAIMPEGLDRRTKEGKAAFADLEQSGKIILSHDDYRDVCRIAISVQDHETASLFLKDGHAEVSIFTEIEGIPAKCRLDWLRPGVICDLKTTDDASPSGFARSCANYGYDMQAAWYLDCAEAAGISIDAFVFIVVEKSAPYAVGLYELDAASLQVGRTKYQRALSLYRHCTDTGEWPGYSPEIISIQLPAWAMREAA
jgi:hypothetical protein